ncbi:MAG: DUF3239 domain-containing protein [Holophagales bacterium]|jgi:hypothetical protein|nr:DUF3239 domain-containing protein [Holophagales bacterium]
MSNKSNIIEKIGTPDTDNPSGFNAARAAHLEADTDRLKKYHPDYNVKKTIINIISGSLILIIGIVYITNRASGGLGPGFKGIVAILSGLISIAVGLYSKRVSKSAVTIYRRGLIVPGIAIAMPDIVLTLADVSLCEDEVFAVQKVKIGEKGDWKFNLNDKFTFCAYFGFVKENIFDCFWPSFLQWATHDDEILSACLKTIDNEEWAMLEKAAPLANDLREGITYIMTKSNDEIIFLTVEDYLKN